MSFLNPTPAPVRLYSHTDSEAPQLPANDWTGALKTLLKACLVTGYGGKPGAGWTLREESDNKAIFRAGDPATSPVELEVDSGNITITTFDLHWQGVKQGINTNWTTGQLNRYTGVAGWYLVASARGFVLLPLVRIGNSPLIAGLAYFGQACTNLVDPGQQDFVLWLAKSNNSGYVSDVPSVLYNGGNAAWSSGSLRLTGKIGDGRNTVLRTAAAARAALRLPANNDFSSILYSEIYLHRTASYGSNNYAVSGRLPGLLVASHRTVSDQTGDIVQVAGSPHRWLLTQQDIQFSNNADGQPGLAVLVNIDEWVY
jgi:hypothetical protein